MEKIIINGQEYNVRYGVNTLAVHSTMMENLQGDFKPSVFATELLLYFLCVSECKANAELPTLSYDAFKDALDEDPKLLGWFRGYIAEQVELLDEAASTNQYGTSKKK